MNRSQRRFPAEWEPQAALLIAWPHESTDWRDSLAAIEAVYIDVVRATTAVQPVWILCQDAVHISHITAQLEAAGIDQRYVEPIIAAYNDTWVRDYGPIAVLENGLPRLLDFRFNGWGGKFESGLDDRVTALLTGAGVFGDVALTALPQILEGGSLETDGAGTLLTTRCCLLDASRNPAMDRAGWEQLFAEQLGCQRTLWLNHGYLAGDDTDGHIDTLARFSDAGTIVHADCDHPEHPNYHRLKEMAAELRAFRQANGEPYRLIALPSPRLEQDRTGTPLPASYANFIILNQRVLVPLYNDPADETALQLLQSAFADREIIGIDARAMVCQGGVLHCASMQIPQVVVD